MLKKLSGRIIEIGYALLILLMLLLVVLTPYGTKGQTTYIWPMWQMLAGGAVLIVVLQILFHKYKGWSCKRPAPVAAILSLILFVVLVYLSHNYYFKTGWDPREVLGAASLIADGRTAEINQLYFSMFPNNQLLVLLYSGVIRLFRMLHLNNDYFACIIFQCALFSLGGYLTYRVTGLLTDMRCAMTAYVVYVLWVGLSPWVTVPYSDGTGIVLPLMMLYLLLREHEQRNVIWSSVLLLALFFLGYVAFKIKPQMFILIIAIVLVWVLDLFTSKERGLLLAKAIPAGLGLVCGYLVVTSFIAGAKLPVDEEMAFSPWYYLCTGAHLDMLGVCNEEDQNFALSYNVKAERDAALKVRFFERVKENGFAGMVELWRGKSLLNYSDGTFGWWIEGGFYGEEIYPDKMPLREKLSKIYYDVNYGGESFPKYEGSMQAIWLVVLALNVLLVFNKNHKKDFWVIMLSIIGLTIFELLFEGRARYLFTYVPVYLVGAMGGWKSLGRK